MPAANKILKYDLAEKALELSTSCTTMEISRLLTEQIQQKGIADSISQPTVARFIKSHRDERANQTRALVEKYVQATTPRDLEILDDIMMGHFNIWKNRQPDPENPEQFTEGAYTDEQRSSAGMKAVRVIETKLKWSGALREDDPEALHRETEKLERELDEDLMRGADAVGTA